jgi:2-keto-3-deoxy-L-rhamnonate aldolase RhmA
MRLSPAFAASFDSRAKLMRQTELKRKLANRERSIGGWITLAHPAIAEIMANAGFEWIVVDLEHSAIGIGEAIELIRTIDLAGAAPLVRLTANDASQIKRVMDGGAHGVIVPMINTEEEARRAVDAVYYQPRGVRGVGLSRAQEYGADFARYRDWLGREAVVIAQIEHIEGVRNLKTILSVAGIDGYIVGPYDLSASLGVPGDFDNRDVTDALARIGEIGRACKKSGGLHIVEPDPELLIRRLEEGFNFIAYSVDIRMLDRACRAVSHIIRKAE